ncbi:MAG: hypothetical protein ABI836_14930 [Gemmatimonadota bacterium]
MKSLIRLLGLVLAILFPLTPAARAQTLAPGTWTGSVTDPQGNEAPVTYDVSVTGDTLHISMTVEIPEGPSAFAFSNIRFDQGKLQLTWSPGVDVDCSLDPAEGGSYAGTCTDSEGKSGQMKMIPPKNG